MLDPSILADFSDSFNLLQDISSNGSDTLFEDVSAQYVAAIPNAFVEGESGLVYDGNSNVYHLDYFFNNRTNPVLPFPHRTIAYASQQCQQRDHQYPQLASIIQRYGHMYYHFLVEALPRVVMLQRAGVLTPSTKLLTWGQPYEAAWFAALGISQDQLVVFDPEAVYCAEILYLPTPIPRITPPREALLLLRDALGIRNAQPSNCNAIIYVSRASEPTRRVSNEQSILKSIARAYPSSPLIIFNGTGMTPRQTIDLFQGAKVILGPHGAGLSHLLFAAPGTAVVEFLFMADPPLMFWHCASALNQEYWMLPVPQSYYMQQEMYVPESEVMDIMAAIMKSPFDAASAGRKVCQGGTAGTLCTQCPPGSYSFMNTGSACKLCAAGRVASTPGSTACNTCKPGTYSNIDGTECIKCPKGTFSTLAGSSSIDQCLNQEKRRRRLEEQVLSVEMLSKLSPMFAQQLERRALIQGKDRVMTLTQQELCSASAAIGAFAGPYAIGPYGTGSGSLVCPSVPATLPPPNSPTPPPSPPSRQPPSSPKQQPPYTLPPTPSPYGTILPPIDIRNNTTTLPLPPLLPPSPDPSVSLPVPSPFPGFDEKGDPIAPAPAPEQPLPPPDHHQQQQGKHVLDTWAIALIATASALVAIPLLVCCGMWCVARRRRSRRARAAMSLKQPQQFATTNPAFNAPLSTPSGSSAGGSSHGGIDVRHEA